MAPKSILLTAGDKPKTKPYIARKPLTTQGKILKATALKEKKAKNAPREALPGSENALGTAMADDSPKPQRAPKAKSFALPDETDALAEELKKRNLAKARGTKKEGWSLRKKPLTTQQNIAHAIAVRRAKGGVENAALSVPAGKRGKRDMPGLMSILKQQDKEFLPMTMEGRERGEGGGGALSWNDIKTAEDKRREKREEERLRSVLFQPNLRARKWRAMYGVMEWAVVKKVDESEKVKDSKTAVVEQGKKTQSPGTAKEGEAAAAKSKPAAGWFTHLPDEARNKIWRLVVIDDKSCVWPTSPTGREQPDLAMTCKQVRREVLPIYYGLNTFGISLQKDAISVDPAPTFQKKKALTGLAAVHKWASTIGNEDVAWLSMIQNWAFEYQDPAVRWGQGAVIDDDDSFVVSLRIKPAARQDRPEQPEGLEEAEEGGEAPQPVSTADVEVHLEASCFMRGWSECGKCRVQETPIELAAAVMWMLEAGVSANTLYKVANELRGMLRTLTKARCVRCG